MKKEKLYCIAYNYKTKQFVIQSSNSLRLPLKYFRIQDFLSLQEAELLLVKPTFNYNTKDFIDLEWLNESVYFNFYDFYIHKRRYDNVIYQIDKYISSLNLIYKIIDNELDTDSIQQLLKLDIFNHSALNIQSNEELKYLCSQECSVKRLNSIHKRIIYIWNNIKNLSNSMETKEYKS